MNKISVGILGATSYTGIELIRRLAFHSGVSIAYVSSQTYAPENITKIFPELKAIHDAILITPEEAQARDVDCIFSCLPHAVSAGILMPMIEKGIRVIDLSADFRLRDPATYKAWYKIEHPCPQLLDKAVYGLPEFYRKEIAKASIVANPGCYVTSVLLPLIPLYKKAASKIDWTIADSKSGVSGAGRGLKLSSHFVEANENLSAYSIGHSHRHTPEIEQELSVAANNPITLTFSPHLVPMSRGILSTIYIGTSLTVQECASIVNEQYKDEPFVRTRDADDLPNTHNVAHSNFCDIAFTGGPGGKPVIAVSALDNLVKGASGQAIQNMNIMFGFTEETGLTR